MTECTCPIDWAHGCFRRDCPRSAAIIEASRKQLELTLKATGDPMRGVSCGEKTPQAFIDAKKERDEGWPDDRC